MSVIRKSGNALTRSLKALYLKLFRIHDSPQRIALGVALGVFCGVFPGIGPIAALGLAFICKANRAAALIGGLVTNTWISVPVFLVAARIGSVMTGSSYQAIRAEWAGLAEHFSWAALFNLSLAGIVLPLLTGYLVISLAMGIGTYAITIGILTAVKKAHNPI